MPGMPLQVLCYERADDLAAGVSGVVTRAQGIRASFPCARSGADSHGRGVNDRACVLPARPDWSEPAITFTACWEIFFFVPWTGMCALNDDAFELPWTPAFLHKQGGLVFSIGQFNQWVASQLMANGLVQIWPGTPVSSADFW